MPKKPANATEKATKSKATRAKNAPAAKATKAVAAKSTNSASKPAPSRRRSKSRKSLRTEEIAVRAYYIYESEGGGDQVEHWLRAERELTAA